MITYFDQCAFIEHIVNIKTRMATFIVLVIFKMIKTFVNSPLYFLSDQEGNCILYNPKSNKLGLQSKIQPKGIYKELNIKRKYILGERKDYYLDQIFIFLTFHQKFLIFQEFQTKVKSILIRIKFYVENSHSFRSRLQ